MDRDTYLGHLGREADALLAAAAGVEPDRPVPTCPDWTVADLLWHIGKVHRFWAAVATEGYRSREDVDAYEHPARPGDDELPGFARAQAHRLLAALAELDPDAPRWNWSKAPQVGAFLPRRMALETAVHRVDAERAAGRAAPVDARLAADGIDELLTVHLPVSGDYDGPSGYLGVAETDTGRAWALHLDPPSATVVSPMRVPKDPKVTERMWGDASQMFLLLWGRAEHGVRGQLDAALIGHLRTG